VLYSLSLFSSLRFSIFVRIRSTAAPVAFRVALCTVHCAHLFFFVFHFPTRGSGTADRLYENVGKRESGGEKEQGRKSLVHCRSGTIRYRCDGTVRCVLYYYSVAQYAHPVAGHCGTRRGWLLPQRFFPHFSLPPTRGGGTRSGPSLKHLDPPHHSVPIQNGLEACAPLPPSPPQRVDNRRGRRCTVLR
jgi:hypothetical protein